jgi:two-component system alkaline phosphatase synthesis response regulator PhoP
LAAAAAPEATRGQPTVLVVDDEATLRETIRFNFEREGYRVLLAADGPAALAAARAERPDLVVLDVMLPGIDGLQVCRELRAESTVPILLLSARGEEIDRVLGLELGADDYLTKPFALRELLARVKAMLRRAQMAGGESGNGTKPEVREAPRPAPAGGQTPLVVGDLAVDPARRHASLGGAALHLKPKEFDLLLYLARHPGIVLSRDALLREVWGYEFPIDTRTVDVHIRGLRAKVEADPSQPKRIETVRGFGYRFEPDSG